jgi:hypothetical protein
MDTLKILKRLVSEGYSLKSHHNNTKWKDALEQGELLIQELSKLCQGAVSGQSEQLVCSICNGKGSYIDTHPERYGEVKCKCKAN